MAGDWIKMRCDLQTHPKVVRIASALKADRLRVIGGLHAAWCLFNVHSEDGTLSGYSPESLDELLNFPGFTSALAAVGWAEIDTDCVKVPDFDTHNGQSAKRRASEADRKRHARKASASDADKMRSREEKSREENKSPFPPSGKRKTKASPSGNGGEKNLPVSENAKTIAGIFHRKLQTEWSNKEVDAFVKLKIDPDDLASVSAYYADHWPPASTGDRKNILRHDLLTFLNNFQGEVDRANTWRDSKPQKETPAELKGIRIVS